MNINQNSENGLKGVKCTECGHRVKSGSSLSQHIRVVHEGMKYPCRQCDYKATSQNHLARHRRAVDIAQK